MARHVSRHRATGRTKSVLPDSAEPESSSGDLLIEDLPLHPVQPIQAIEPTRPVAVDEVEQPGSSVEGGELSAPLGKTMGKGLAWSLLNNAIGRLGNFLSGIIIVRILSPEDYGTYAVGMVVLAVVLSMNELGVSVAVVQRKGSVEGIAPTVATLSILSSLILAAVAFFAAPAVASTMDAPEAVGLIRLLVLGVVIDGIVSVPNALITRAFQQRTRLKIDLIAFVTGTPVTIGLALAGYGAWSLGWGAIVGNVVTGALAIAWAPAHYWPGWNREAAREVLKFGMPLAGASLLLFLMLNVDYIIVGHLLGAEQLGLYLLAFNLCSWPITVISTAIRRVSLAAFSRMHENGDEGSRGFERSVGLVMAMTLPLCVLLAGFAMPVIDFLYGSKWSAAAEPLRFLAVLSAGRVAVELTYDYLAAIGRTRSSLWLHAIWLAALIPALTVGAKVDGITGVAAGHAAVVVVVLLPMLAVMLHRAGVSLTGTLRTMAPVLIGAALTIVVMLGVLQVLHGTLLLLTIGIGVCSVVYLIAILPMRHTARAMWNMAG
ncbi:lipopolysaccharide biosynthesis protein [Jatrophihabitans sp. DSM 45814]